MRLCDCGNKLESEFDDVCLQCFEEMEASEDKFLPLKFDDDGFPDNEPDWFEDDED